MSYLANIRICSDDVADAGVAPWVDQISEIKVAPIFNVEAERKVLGRLPRSLRTKGHMIQEPTVKIELM